MRYVLDTSVLIAASGVPVAVDEPMAISVVSLTELHFGVLTARDDALRATRLAILGAVERYFEPLLVDDVVAREWGRLYAAVQQRGGEPRRRALDLAIAATANVQRATLL